MQPPTWRGAAGGGALPLKGAGRGLRTSTSRLKNARRRQAGANAARERRGSYIHVAPTPARGRWLFFSGGLRKRTRNTKKPKNDSKKPPVSGAFGLVSSFPATPGDKKKKKKTPSGKKKTKKKPNTQRKIKKDPEMPGFWANFPASLSNSCRLLRSSKAPHCAWWAGPGCLANEGPDGEAAAGSR